MLGLLAITLAGLLTGAPPADQRNVDLRVTEADEDRVSWPVLDELVAGTVLDVVVRGAEPFSSGEVAQCDVACISSYPVRFDGNGTARFQYQLTGGGDCDAGGSCTLRVTAGDRVATAFVVFGGPASPTPDVEVSPTRPEMAGQPVTVTVTGSEPGSSARASWCDDDCDRTAFATADATGRATLTLEVGDRCDDCGILVVAASTRRFVPVAFVDDVAASTRYDTRRVVAGLGVAALLLAGAWWLIVTTDWRPPSEAAVTDPGD